MSFTWAGKIALAALTLAPAASFADRWDNNYPREGYRDNAFSAGFERGQRDGQHEGWNDGSHGRRMEFWRESDYRDADNGYRRSYGSRAAYAQGYRRGYQEAYRQSYQTALDRNHDGQWRDRRSW
jgi:hypothetical protein